MGSINQFLTQGHTLFENKFSLNLNNLSHRSNEILGKKSAISTRKYIFDILVLENLWSDFENF